jgi:hypothetical protein
MSLPAVALSIVALALPRGAPAWLLAACAAHTLLLGGEGAVARAVAAALAFRAALLLATLLHEVRAHAQRANLGPSRPDPRRKLTRNAAGH